MFAGSFNFCNIQNIVIRDCSRVKWLFTVSTAKSLTSLRELKIYFCDELQFVVKDETVSNDNRKNDNRKEELALFPNLNTLHLWALPKLIKVYSGWEMTPQNGKYILDCPELIV